MRSRPLVSALLGCVAGLYLACGPAQSPPATSSTVRVANSTPKAVAPATPLAVALAPAAPVAPIASVAPLSRIALRAHRVVDVRGGRALSDATILVEGDRIVAVGSHVVVPSDARVVDLGDATIVPGLVDAHTHLLDEMRAPLSEESNHLRAVAQRTTTARALRGAAVAREDLEAGITTVRDAGNAGLNGDVALRDAIAAGWVDGPRMLVSTRALAPLGGQFGSLSREAQPLVELEYSTVRGPESARQAVRQAVFDGADWIKVIAESDGRTLSLDEVKAIVEEARASHRKVAVHATTLEASKVAIDAGVDSIEHGYTLGDPELLAMARKKIALVPTDPPLDVLLPLLDSIPVAKDRARAAEAMRVFDEKKRRRLSRAFALGVRIVGGSDAYWLVPGKTRGQVSVATVRGYAAAGLPPLAILRAWTLHAAELLGMEDRIGAVEPGRLADLLAVQGDPLADVGALEHAVFVMKNGFVVKDHPTRP